MSVAVLKMKSERFVYSEQINEKDTCYALPKADAQVIIEYDYRWTSLLLYNYPF